MSEVLIIGVLHHLLHIQNEINLKCNLLYNYVVSFVFPEGLALTYEVIYSNLHLLHFAHENS